MPLEKQYSFEDLWLIKLKTRLQWTGWLQYLLPLPAAMALLTIASAARYVVASESLMAHFWFVTLPRALGCLLIANALFDIATCKYDMRPLEPEPKRRDHMNAFDVMRARRSCRSFQTRKLSKKDLEELIESVKQHVDPSYLVGSNPIRLLYVSEPMRVWPVVGAHEFLVAVAPKEYDAMSVIDVGRSLQKVVLHATRMGLGTCWIGPGADQDSVIWHLGDSFDKERDHVIVTCAIGYRSMFQPLAIRLLSVVTGSVRLPLGSLFFSDASFCEPQDLAQKPFSLFGRCYEVCRWAPSSYNAQPTRCVARIDRRAPKDAGNCEDDHHDQLVPAFDFFCATTSRFYGPIALGIWLANWEAGCDNLGIKGQFSVLGPEERGAAPREEEQAAEVPKYYISWLPSSVSKLS